MLKNYNLNLNIIIIGHMPAVCVINPTTASTSCTSIKPRDIRKISQVTSPPSQKRILIPKLSWWDRCLWIRGNWRLFRQLSQKDRHNLCQGPLSPKFMSSKIIVAAWASPFTTMRPMNLASPKSIGLLTASMCARLTASGFERIPPLAISSLTIGALPRRLQLSQMT